MKTSKFAMEVAKILLKENAVQLKPKNPFTWSSGLRSPIYCDNRMLLSSVYDRRQITKFMGEVADDIEIFPNMICGVATAGIAWATLLAEEEDLSMGYCRAESKSHGLRNQLEGRFEKGKKVLVVEDLISTGGSTMHVIEALKDAEMHIAGVISIFSYGFEKAKHAFEEAEVEVVSLCDFVTLLHVAQVQNYITEEEHALLATWSENPQDWSENYLLNTKIETK